MLSTENEKERKGKTQEEEDDDDADDRVLLVSLHCFRSIERHYA
jgi:hypothetical protein